MPAPLTNHHERTYSPRRAVSRDLLNVSPIGCAILDDTKRFLRARQLACRYRRLLVASNQSFGARSLLRVAARARIENIELNLPQCAMPASGCFADLQGATSTLRVSKKPEYLSSMHENVSTFGNLASELHGPTSSRDHISVFLRAR